MKKVLINYGGAILLYLVIFVGIIAISSRMTYINKEEMVKVAINK